jgi:hypothetical protein
MALNMLKYGLGCEIHQLFPKAIEQQYCKKKKKKN